MIKKLFIILLIGLSFSSCQAQSKKIQTNRAVSLLAPKGRAVAAFAEGCFWCSEHIYESVLIYYNPKIISYKELIKVFFTSHDPTTLNRQGPDEGSSYRSVIFYQNETEKMLAKQALSDLTLRGAFKRPVVTELLPLKIFWRAEEYHQDFIKKNPNQPYVKGVSMPRFEQFKKSYKPSKSK